MSPRCLFLGNCGLLLRTETSAILVDAPNRRFTAFDSMPEAEREALMAFETPYNSLCGLFFTHYHGDHFDRKTVRELVDRRRELMVLIPNGETPASGVLTCGDFTVTYLTVAHSGAEFSQVNHRTLLIEAEGKCLYVTGDADWAAPEHDAVLSRYAPDFVFCNPNYLTHEEGRALLRRTRRCLLYHLPVTSPDSLGIYRKCRTAWERYGRELPNVILADKYPMEIDFS